METIVKCKVSETGKAEVSFEGEHISKRAFLRVLKALKAEYRRQVKVYHQGIRKSNKEKEKDNGKEARTERAEQRTDSSSDRVAKAIAAVTGAKQSVVGASQPSESGKGTGEKAGSGK
jgi:hypothetical protein